MKHDNKSSSGSEAAVAVVLIRVIGEMGWMGCDRTERDGSQQTELKETQSERRMGEGGAVSGKKSGRGRENILATETQCHQNTLKCTF